MSSGFVCFAYAKQYDSWFVVLTLESKRSIVMWKWHLKIEFVANGHFGPLEYQNNSIDT